MEGVLAASRCLERGRDSQARQHALYCAGNRSGTARSCGWRCPMPNTSMAIANEFLRKPGATGRLTQMQLLKLAYIAHGWNLAVSGTPLISEDIQAWDYGPVVPALYDHIKFYGSRPITREIQDTDDQVYRFFSKSSGRAGHPYHANVSESEKDVIERVWQRYGMYSGLKLSDLTHRPGTPWFETYFGDGKGAVIPNGRIRAHYLELARSGA